MSRRKRSSMKRADCVKALAKFAPLVERFLETSDASAFCSEICPSDKINVQFLVRGSFGVANDVFEAIRILAGHKIAADDKRPRSKP